MKTMTLKRAKKISEYTEALIAKDFANKPYSIAVVDHNGFIVLYHKQDGAKLLTINLTPAKAYTAARMGQSTVDFLNRLQRENLDISYFADSGFVAMPGGSPIFDENNNLIGAVGIGGLKEDGEISAKIASIATTL